MGGGGGGGLLGSIFGAVSGLFGVTGGDAASTAVLSSGYSGNSLNLPDIPNVDFGGFRVTGGPVMPDLAYMAGERGPEMFMPSKAGYIIPNNDLGPSGGRSGRITFDLRGAVMTQGLLQQMNTIAADHSRGAVIGAKHSEMRAQGRRFAG